MATIVPPVPPVIIGAVRTGMATARFVNNSKMVGAETCSPAPGIGWLAGTLPGGVTTVDGVPVRATVRVLWRPAGAALGDGYLVAETQSGYDGTWHVDGLDPTLKYDVIGRKPGFNDVIMANVSPKSGPAKPQIVGQLRYDSSTFRVTGQLGIYQGVPPYTISYTGMPPGTSLSVSGKFINPAGQTTDQSKFAVVVNLTVTDSVGTSNTFSLDLGTAGVDPSFSKVVALLRFQGADESTTFNDETGRIWTPNAGAKIDTGQVKFGVSSGYFNGVGDGIQSSIFQLDGDYTAEGWAYLEDNTGVKGIFYIGNLNSNQQRVMLSFEAGKLVMWRQGVTGTGVGTYGTSTSPAGQWVHFAATREGTTERVFIMGQKEIEATVSLAAYPMTGALYVGVSRSASLHQPFKGWLADFRLTAECRYRDNFPVPPFQLPNRAA